MKKFIPFLSFIFVFAACNTDKQESETRTIQSTRQNAALDTAGLAQFQQWKAQNELNAATPVQQEQEVTAAAPVKTVTVYREVRAKQPAPVRKTVKQTRKPSSQSPSEAESKDNTSSGNSDATANSGNGSGTENAPSQQETAKNGGWSNAKKGAVIGSAGGAVVGAVVNKRNRAVGAIIGGVLGGAAGYGIGKKKDGKEVQQ